jgi:hypothetical protein
VARGALIYGGRAIVGAPVVIFASNPSKLTPISRSVTTKDGDFVLRLNLARLTPQMHPIAGVLNLQVLGFTTQGLAHWSFPLNLATPTNSGKLPSVEARPSLTAGEIAHPDTISMRVLPGSAPRMSATVRGVTPQYQTCTPSNVGSAYKGFAVVGATYSAATGVVKAMTDPPAPAAPTALAPYRRSGGGVPGISTSSRTRYSIKCRWTPGSTDRTPSCGRCSRACHTNNGPRWCCAFYEGFDDAEIGQLLDCKETTVRAHVSRGLANLPAGLPPGGTGTDEGGVTRG